MKKTAILFLALILLFSSAVGVYASALSLDAGVEALRAEFEAGAGPAVNGYSIDYSFYSPVKNNDNTKYPLVVWLHGMGDGGEPGKPVQTNNAAQWVSDEYQARFEPAGGAFVFMPRSPEEDRIFWSDDMIVPLRTAIDDFIAKNSDNIDVTRIYVGGYSMGGKMTLKMAAEYPEMFAAAFPICPAWRPSEEVASQSLSEMPIWITSGKPDPLVNYYFMVSQTWKTIVNNSTVKEDCRFSSLSKVCYADGKKAPSGHHSWYSVNNDMFSAENGDYPHMTTVNGAGEAITLTYPDGMISWLSQFTSDYDGKALEPAPADERPEEPEKKSLFDKIADFFRQIFGKSLCAFEKK